MNIFLTVGAQMPFDRLVQAVDEWAGEHVGDKAFGQIGDTTFLPKNIDFVHLLQPAEFRRRVLWADLLVAHAGMGSILTALQFGKPILVMPRLGRLNETRNDHQVASAERFKSLSKIAVAMNEVELVVMLSSAQSISAGESIAASAGGELVSTVSHFIHSARH